MRKNSQERFFTRRRSIAAVLAVAMIVLYLGVLLFYYETADSEKGSLSKVPNKLTVQIRPQSIDPDDQTLNALIDVAPPNSLLDDTNRLLKDMEVYFPLSNQSFYFQAKSRVLRENVQFTFPTNTFERYPFDGHELPLAAIGYIVNDDGRQSRIQTVLQLQGDVSGWKLDIPSVVPSQLQEQLKLNGNFADTGLANLRMSRAGSTIAIVVVIMLSLIMLGVFAVLVVRGTATQRRYADPGLAGWFAALLFAVFPLRLNLPGAPPIGAWIDYVVFLWVVVTLLMTLGVFVFTWLRYGDPPRRLWRQVEAGEAVD